MSHPLSPSPSRPGGHRGTDARRPGIPTLATGLAVVAAAVLLAGCTGLDPGASGGPSDQTQTQEPSAQGSGSGDGGAVAADGADGPRNDTPWTGAWLGEWPDERNETLARFEHRTAHRPAKVDLQVPWNTSYEKLEPTLDHLDENGTTPIISWYPTNLTADEVGDASTRVPLQDGRNVTVEAYVTSYAEGICRFHDRTGRTVLLEPMPEPNGDWHPWAVGYEDPIDGTHSNSAGDYVAAWRSLHERFTSVCPDGAEFVWTVNAANRGPGTGYEVAYPGDDHVDVVGIRGINMGAHQPEGWATFGQTFGDAYCAVTDHTDKDVILAGVGSVEEGGDKAQWIREAYRNASSHAWDRIQGVVWYDDTMKVDGKALDVSLDSSAASLEAYRVAVDEVEDGEIPEGEAPAC